MSIAALERLEAIEAITALKARYFRLLDTKDWASFRALFTDDMVFYFESDAPKVRSGDEFVAFVRVRLATATTVHQGHMPEIELLSASTARGTWAMFDWVDDPDQNRAFQGFGHYRELYRRDADGTWRIAELRLSRIRVDEVEPSRAQTTSTPSPR
ncbi:nuclear transport factor 2 family protein [Phytohabitans suffuscus]|uniref:Bile-acid 7-alpha-dehydratase n=1 Tax=Phytohabitans suffuscus TaxID=624315 RepID=A0A6F8YQZ2_9ACTN|nr:nuclear transport factor 2 family protein [Phytohabitans suffuscus]BCB88567.1 bile-acid 7-alpha-dehydratase [Phytohabitans suffuscus]